MKKNRNLIVIVLSVLSFYSCGIGEWDTALYAQKIQGTSKILYKYSAFGGRDSQAFGYVILDSIETFKVNGAKNLPFMQLKEIPKDNIIIGINYICDNGCGENYHKIVPVFTPLKKDTFNYQNIKIINNVYQVKGFQDRDSGLATYEFETFIETKDSVFFYNLNDNKAAKPRHLDSLKLKKRHIVLEENKNSEIVQIRIEDLRFNEKTDEILFSKPYRLTPKNKMKSSLFSEYGYFKSVNK